MVFWKFFLLLVSIRSIELGLIGFLKQVGPTTRLYKLYVSQNDFIAASSTSQLKSPKIIKFSNLHPCVYLLLVQAGLRTNLYSFWCGYTHQLRTERAAYFHILRVHLQIVIWKYLGRVQIDPRAWVWEVKGGVFSPIMTDLEPAPKDCAMQVQVVIKETMQLKRMFLSEKWFGMCYRMLQMLRD